MILKLHGYIVIAASILLFFTVFYGYFYDHKEYIHFDKEWVDAFQKENIPLEVIEDITHDDDTWYYTGKSLCVGYGDWNEKCKMHENFCGGGKVIGNINQQASAVAQALRNGGIHKMCPIVYQGMN